MLKFIEFEPSERGRKMHGLAFSINYKIYNNSGPTYTITFSQEMSLEVAGLRLRVAFEEFTDEVFLVWGKDGVPVSSTGKQGMNVTVANKAVVTKVAEMLKIDLSKPMREVWGLQKVKDNVYKITSKVC